MKFIMRPFSLVIFFYIILTFPVSSAAEAQTTITEQAVIARVIDGDTVELQDGRLLRLDAINALEIPHRPEDSVRCLPSTRTGGSKNFGCDLTLALAARALLEQLVANRAVTLRLNPQRREDRYGRVLADIEVPDADGRIVSAAGELVKAGLAHVYPLSGQEIAVSQLLALEERARHDRLGIWRLPELQVTPAAQAATQYGHYALIRGKVINTVKLRNKIHLNFGADYRTDFTVTLDKRDWSRFRDMDLLALQERSVLVRGFLHEDYGPALRLTNPSQITFDLPITSQ